jgi:hypothetical protein
VWQKCQKMSDMSQIVNFFFLGKKKKHLFLKQSERTDHSERYYS